MAPKQPQQQAQMKQQKVLKKKLSPPKWVRIANVVVGLTLAIMLLTAGFGLLELRKWALQLSIGYTALSILAQLANAGVSFLYSLSQMQSIGPRAANPQTAAAIQVGMWIVNYFEGATRVIMSIYPPTVFLVMMVPSVRDALAGRRRVTDDVPWVEPA